MSLAVYQSMKPISLSNDVNAFTIYSSNYGQTNFYYIYYIIDTNGVLSSLKQSPSPTNTGFINPNLIAKNMTSYTFKHNITGCTSSVNSVYQYRVSYGSVSDGTYDTIVESPVVTLLNGASRYIEYQVDISDYVLDSSTSKFLSSYNDREIDLVTDDYYVLSFLNGNFTNTSYNSTVKYIVIEFPNGSKYSIANPDFGLVVSDTLFAVDKNKIIKNVGVGPRNLVECTALLNYPTGSGVRLTSEYFTNNPEYVVYAVNGSGTKVSNNVMVNVSCKRSYNKYQIFYMNDFGQFDSISFNNGNWIDFDNKTTTYRQDNYRVVNNQYVYTNGNRGLTTLNKTSEKSLTVVTSYSLYDEVLQDMILSTSHYLVDGETIIPMILDTNKLKTVDKVSSMLNSIPVTFNYANKININL